MAFLTLRTASFRNLADAAVTISAKNVFLVGENGQGKTNFLEALYFCSYASSFRGVKDTEIAASGAADFSAAAELGTIQNNAANAVNGREFLRKQITVTAEKSRKSITVDGKKISDRRDLVETIPTVVFCHEDMEFVSGSQERRRWFFDQTQGLYDPVYLDDLRRYRRVLKTRNTVLKNAKTGGDFGKAAEILDALDPQLAEYGIRLMEKRKTAADRFSVIFSPLYREVSDIDGITVGYAPSWKIPSGESDSINDIVLNNLAKARAADMAQGITLSGPHRDRYLFIRNMPSGGRGDFSGNASTGQRRLLALLLRIAQARCFSDLTGKMPVLLLDDVLLELDGEKRRRFLSVMPGYEQAFFTFLPEEPYNDYFNSGDPSRGEASGTMVYHVRDGVIKPLT